MGDNSFVITYVLETMLRKTQVITNLLSHPLGEYLDDAMDDNSFVITCAVLNALRTPVVITVLLSPLCFLITQ